MAQILHQRATTTHAIRAQLQRSTDSIATLSRRYNINPKPASTNPGACSGRSCKPGCNLPNVWFTQQNPTYAP